MPVTLSITDNATTPTGVTFTVTGIASGTLEIFVSQVTANMVQGMTWNLQIAIPASSPVSGGFALSPGYYLAYAVQAGTGLLSEPIYFNVTTGLDAIETQCFSAISAQIQLTNLPCVQNIYDYQNFDQSNAKSPGVILWCQDATETDMAVLNNTDYIGHPVKLAIFDRLSRYDQTARDMYLNWRQAIFRSLHDQRLGGVQGSMITKCEFGNISDVTTATIFQFFTTALVVRCKTREPRGLGA